MSGAKHRQKGNHTEREIVDLHKSINVHAKRYPLSGASRFRGSGHDVDVYACGREQAPFVCEVKARKDGKGFVPLEKWLAEFDALFLRRNHSTPLVVLPWRTWVALVAKFRAEIRHEAQGFPRKRRRPGRSPVSEQMKP